MIVSLIFIERITQVHMKKPAATVPPPAAPAAAAAAAQSWDNDAQQQQQPVAVAAAATAPSFPSHAAQLATVLVGGGGGVMVCQVGPRTEAAKVGAAFRCTVDGNTNGIEGKHQYCFTVSSVNSLGASPPSPQACITTGTSTRTYIDYILPFPPRPDSPIEGTSEKVDRSTFFESAANSAPL